MATTTERPKWNVVGTRPIRHDGTDKVTGRAKYGADIQLPGLLHGKVLRSPHAHARIKRIDTSKAEALQGVAAVVTYRDVPEPPEGPVTYGELYQLVRHTFMYDKYLARDKVVYKGHPIAAVAAANPHVAEEALRLIEVDFEVLPPLMDVLDAMKDDALLIHEGVTTREMGADTGKKSNVATHQQVIVGDIEKGFGEADIVIEHEFRTSPVHPGYIEPQNSTAHWDVDGHLTIWTSTQGQFPVRDQVANFFGIPASRISIMPVEIGGGFGGKVTIYLEPLAALLSRKANHQPVKVVMSRADVLEATGPTSGSYVWVKMGAKKDGSITAAKAWMAYEAGGFPGSPMGGAVRTMLAPYRIDNVQIDAYDVVVNKPRAGAYRAPGVTNASFAVETIVDEICEQIGMDALDFKLKNAIKEGDHTTMGTPVTNTIGNNEVIRAAKDSDHYAQALETPTGKYRGRGVASGGWHTGGGESSCIMTVMSDGTVGMMIGTMDIGGHRTSVAMMAAEILGLQAEDIRIGTAGTDSIAFSALTAGSSTTYKTGLAAIGAAEEINRQMTERAAKIWETTADNVEIVDGVFHHKADSSLKMTFKELAGQLLSTGGAIVASYQNSRAGGGDTFTTHVVDLEVDPETGKVEILRYTAVHDVGQAIHPSYVEGQIQGGVAQGIGWALNEEYFYNDQGIMTNASLLDYRMPTSLDLPMLDTILVEVPNPTHPFGVRGIGEPPIIPPPAAIANALYQALGIRMKELPMSPGRVLEALWEKQNGS